MAKSGKDQRKQKPNRKSDLKHRPNKRPFRPALEACAGILVIFGTLVASSAHRLLQIWIVCAALLLAAFGAPLPKLVAPIFSCLALLATGFLTYEQLTAPNEFPSFDVEASKYTFFLGSEQGIMTEYTPDQLRRPQQLPIDFFGSKFPISVFTDGKHLLANVILRESMNGASEISIRGNKLFGKPPLWDANSNKRAFEVVDDAGDPVFQMYYKDKSTIVINGVFCFDRNIIVADSSGVMGPFSSLQDARDFAHSEIKRIFKYPSWKYEGVPSD